MIKTKNLTYETIEQQDNFIQSLSISDIKNQIIGQEITVDKIIIEQENEDFESDFEIQNLSLDKLKTLANINKENLSIQHKITKTGLDANTILLIETNKNRATLEELITYCKGLNISYQTFLPELFV